MLKNYYLSKTIFRQLEQNIEMRDNYLLLCAQIHQNEMQLFGYKKEDYFELVYGEKLSNVQSIVRLWRLIQEKCPHLRGKDWEERQRQGGLIRSEIAEDNDSLRQLRLFE